MPGLQVAVRFTSDRKTAWILGLRRAWKSRFRTWEVGLFLFTGRPPAAVCHCTMSRRTITADGNVHGFENCSGAFSVAGRSMLCPNGTGPNRQPIMCAGRASDRLRGDIEVRLSAFDRQSGVGDESSRQEHPVFSATDIGEFQKRPRFSGVPFLAPWADLLNEQAFWANGKRYQFNMGLGNVRGNMPIHGLLVNSPIGKSRKWRRTTVRRTSRAASDSGNIPT